MKLFPDTKIYIICPGNTHTGGPELLHQLCSQLIKLDVEAYMFYTSGNMANPIDDFYVKYHCPYVLEIEDKPHNILIMPETANWAYFAFKRVRKIFWWLSVDNYISSVANTIMSHINSALIAPMPKIFYFDEDNTEHWVQSEYARQFIKLNGVSERRIRFVEDYLNPAFLTKAANIDITKKENIVAYNPKKGIETTTILKMLDENIDWRPIQNMTPEQVQELLAKSKVYIDFGNHPGKDRIPREAAISDCVVITGKRGAAANSIDINIPDEFKFDDTGNLMSIIDKIHDVFNNFETNYAEQYYYRKRILDDKRRFENEVVSAFNLIPKKKDFIAIAQGLSDKGKKLFDIFVKQGTTAHFTLDNRYCTGEHFAADKFVATMQNSNYYLPERGGAV